MTVNNFKEEYNYCIDLQNSAMNLEFQKESLNICIWFLFWLSLFFVLIKNRDQRFFFRY